MLKILQILIDFIFSVWPQARLNPQKAKDVKIIAHRGCHETGLIENTLSAFMWCIEHKIWAIEFDIHFTSDNVAVVHHDEHCGRLFGKPDLIIAQTTSDELRKQIPEIPALKEVLEKCSRKIHLMIEIKTVLTPEQNDILKSLLSSLSPKEDYHLLSLKTENFEAVNFASSDCFVPVSELNVKSLMNCAIQTKCAGLAGHYLLITSSKKRQLSKLGIATGVGYISSKNSLLREVSKGHEWIFTNHPNRLLSILA